MQLTVINEQGKKSSTLILEPGNSFKISDPKDEFFPKITKPVMSTVEDIPLSKLLEDLPDVTGLSPRELLAVGVKYYETREVPEGLLSRVLPELMKSVITSPTKTIDLIQDTVNLFNKLTGKGTKIRKRRTNGEVKNAPIPEANIEFPPGMQYVGPDISGWPINNVLHRVYLDDKGNIVFDFDANLWPEIDHEKGKGNVGVSANSWVIDYERNRSAPWEFMRPGVTTRPVKNINGKHIFGKAWGARWKPRKNVVYGLCVTTVCRGAFSPENFRTQVLRLVLA